jgi:hypothetical protein
MEQARRAMTGRIQITIDDVVLEAELNDSRTAQAVWDALPLEAEGSFWGKEIYFPIPVDLGPEDPQEVVDPGALAYWPVGKAFCIFWGPTPVSRGEECRPYSPVNVFGRIIGDLNLLDRVQIPRVRVERVLPPP